MFLEERAALLSQRASEAAAVAREAVTDAADFNNVHASIVAKHRKMFLKCAFGITSDGTVTIELKKEFKSVKTYEKYTNMIHVISNWCGNDVLKEASSDDPVASAIQKFHKSNTRGYNYVRDFKIEASETRNVMSPKGGFSSTRSLGALSATCSTSLKLSTKLIADKAI